MCSVGICNACKMSVRLPSYEKCTWSSCPRLLYVGPSLPSVGICNACAKSFPLPSNNICTRSACPRVLYVEPSPQTKTTSTDLSDAAGMTGVDFEVFVRDCLIKKGYTNVETTPASGDYGADLIVRQSEKPRVIAIQCKRSETPIGVKAVQEVLGAKKFYGAHEAWVVTNSTYTSAAIKLAKAARVRLKRLVWSCTPR
jgi:hypothetical protein